MQTIQITIQMQQLHIENFKKHITSQKIATQFQARIAKLGEHSLVGQARGVGLIGSVEIVADKETKRSYDPAAKVGALIQNAAQEHGLITRAMPGDILGFCPPLVISSEEVDELFDRFNRAINEVERQLKLEGTAAAQQNPIVRQEHRYQKRSIILLTIKDFYSMMKNFNSKNTL